MLGASLVAAPFVGCGDGDAPVETRQATPMTPRRFARPSKTCVPQLVVRFGGTTARPTVFVSVPNQMDFVFSS